MIDRPLVRHDLCKPEDDQWMLDRWTARDHHVVTIHYRDRRIPTGRGMHTIERDFRAVCKCGWRSIETVTPHQDVCPVGEALAERRQREARTYDRVLWLPLVGGAVVEPDPRD